MLSNCGAGGLLRVPWTARWSNQSLLKEINPEYSLEGLMLKLKLQYFGYMMWRTDSFEKILLMGKIEGRRRRGRQRRRWLVGITDSKDMSLSKIWELVMWWPGKPEVQQSMGSQRVGHDRATELNWTEFVSSSFFFSLFFLISWRLITLQFWTLWEKARVGCFKRTASKNVYYLGWNRSPAQVGCMRQVLRAGALGRPRGIG